MGDLATMAGARPESKPVTEADARVWCVRHGFEFQSWRPTVCGYRDPRPDAPVEFTTAILVRHGSGGVTCMTTDK